VDQFGGNNDMGPVLEAYDMWVAEFGKESADARFQKSAVRLLLNSFRTGLFENPYLDVDSTVEIVGNPDFMAEGYDAQLKSIVMLKNHGGILPAKDRQKIYVPSRYIAPRRGFGGQMSEGRWEMIVDRALLEKYYDVAQTPEEADLALVCIREPSAGMSAGYDVNDRQKGGNGYVPISLQYGPYTATEAREVSLAGGDPFETSTNRSYKGKTVMTANESELDMVISTRKAMGDKPVIVAVNVSKPLVMGEFEPYADAILVNFGVQNQALLDIISGKAEPSALLPMQMPEDMAAVETQLEDVPRDMRCYKDADGNVYDFGFGLGWSGTISDGRTEKYR